MVLRLVTPGNVNAPVVTTLNTSPCPRHVTIIITMVSRQGCRHNNVNEVFIKPAVVGVEPREAEARRSEDARSKRRAAAAARRGTAPQQERRRRRRSDGEQRVLGGT